MSFPQRKEFCDFCFRLFGMEGQGCIKNHSRDVWAVPFILGRTV